MAAISPEDGIKLAQAGQEMLRKDFYSAAFIIMGAAILGLVAWVVWLQQQLSGLNERHANKLEALAVDSRNVILENGRTLFTLARYIEEGIPPGRRRAPSPILTPESVSKVTLPPGAPKAGGP